MSALAIPLLIAGTAMTAVSKVGQGIQADKAEEYNAAVAMAQAQSYKDVGAFQSKTLTQQSQFEQAKIQREKKLTQSTQRARYAKSGVRIDEGSPLEVQADTAAQYELDFAASKYNLATGLEQIRYSTESGVAMSESEAAYRKMLGKQKKSAGYWGAGTTLLTGLGTMGAMGAFGSGASKIASAPVTV